MTHARADLRASSSSYCARTRALELGTAVAQTRTSVTRRLQGQAFGAAAGVLGAAAAMRRQEMDRNGAQVEHRAYQRFPVMRMIVARAIPSIPVFVVIFELGLVALLTGAIPDVSEAL